jgi:acetyltransferase-like isoleucine patch superfamily enzyme
MISRVEEKLRGITVRFIHVPFLQIVLKLYGVKMGANCKIIGKPVISRHNNSQITLGNRAVLVSKISQTALGVSRPVILRTMTENSKIFIGEDTGLSGTTICSAISVEIGARCLIGADVLIVDTDFHQVDVLSRRYLPHPAPKPEHRIVIGDDVFIGARSIILKGVSIGNGSVIGAGTVVTKNVPTNVIVAGNPASVVRALDFKAESLESNQDI